jgi:acyl-CoA dehydrogenase
MALTEPGGGTDILGALSTFAQDAGDSWVINGNKIFITGAHVADVIFTVCRTERDARRSQSWSTIMVPRPSAGMTIRPVQKISCHHCDSVEINFADVVVPKENLIGTRGAGYGEIMSVLNPERIGIAMMGVGTIAAIYERCLRYVQERHAFGGPIARFQALQHYLADMYINLENSRNLTYKAAWLCDTGQPFHLEATMAKLVAAEGARHAGTYGPEIFGGYGICDEYPVSMYARDAYQIQFSPISNEMSRNVLMQFQGLPKSWA